MRRRHLAILFGCCACSLRVLALTPPQLSCKVRGFYPFPGGPRGPVAWLFRDTHQALSVVGEDKARLHMDFMTEGGQAHPVWWDEGVKWKVLLGQSIQGEVRIRSGGRGGLRLVEGMGGVASGLDTTSPSSKLERLREIAEGYDCSMNLYSNNCRIFCARMRRATLTRASRDARPPAKAPEAPRQPATAPEAPLQRHRPPRGAPPAPSAVPGPPYCTCGLRVRAARTGLLRAVRTGGAGQRAPGRGRYCTYGTQEG